MGILQQCSTSTIDTMTPPIGDIDKHQQAKFSGVPIKPSTSDCDQNHIIPISNKFVHQLQYNSSKLTCVNVQKKSSACLLHEPVEIAIDSLDQTTTQKKTFNNRTEGRKCNHKRNK
ncbi:hypothetical protein HS088_TW23G00226 [Tripterygium wilfordii]|uniref:Uncharacterized protein n=1 Tax=Tripterygium wilfordii TaxID=458696 RepID=A0A7J7BU88_TRIWF|nr:hypothetical protein HS088_TW23G00226 [Tripterygium wilfordii]